ncbi:MAG: DUF2264 domain-containing protein [Marinilabiliaceae bacterium]|nr:DUF2264 domain-containing protein [Marinilabiliaceae bacterium]
MNRLIVLVVIIFLFIDVQSEEINDSVLINEQSVFNINNPDFNISPYTGMTREHWIEAAKYLLTGAFSYINSLDDPMKFPKQPGKSYPHNEDRIPTEKLEGVCRTLFIAAPLLKEDTGLIINNIKVADYYRHQILNLIDSTSESYIKPKAKNAGPNQNLVEFGALAISLFIIPDVLWEPLTTDEKDKLANIMISFGDGPTVPSNWKFFNIFILSFFKDQGYQVNESLLETYLNKSLEHYRGDGWYNDNPAYDYYSMWAFQLYGVVWAELFGKKYYPNFALQFINNLKDITASYPYMFSRNGKMIMWGRSISYRMGAVAPLPFLGKYNDGQTNLGWMRRIASSTMLQFIKHPDFLEDMVPTLGFYGAFEPAVQNYSCRGSAFWLGKVFLGLLVPKENPFWTDVECEGDWSDKFETNKVYNIFSDKSEILITDYPNSGASEIRAWCHEKVQDDWQKFRSTENYNRLSYNSEFPWQADDKNGTVSMNYVIKNKNQEWEAWRLYTFKKFEDGAYYRDVVLETDENVKMNLVDIPLPNGILRVDRNISNSPLNLRLGHYSLPQFDDKIKTYTVEVDKYKATIIDNGEYQLAMVPLLGWSSVEVMEVRGVNPISSHSSVVNLSNTEVKTGRTPFYFTLMMWKKSGDKWENKELNPIQRIKINKLGDVVILFFKDGTQKTICF